MAFTDKTWAFQEGLESVDFNLIIRDNFRAVGPHLVTRITSDQAVSTSTMTDATGMLVPVLANETWLIEALVLLQTTSSDLKFGWTFPSGSLGFLMETVAGSRGGGGSPSPVNTSMTTAFVAGGSVGVPYKNRAIWYGAGTGGNVQMQFATQGVGTATIKTHSTMWAVKLA